jgi:hypothetical protein
VPAFFVDALILLLFFGRDLTGVFQMINRLIPPNTPALRVRVFVALAVSSFLLALFPSAAANPPGSGWKMAERTQPGRFLAKIAAPGGSPVLQEVIRGSGMRIVHRFESNPELLVLDLNAGSSTKNNRSLQEPLDPHSVEERVALLKASGQFEFVEPDAILQMHSVLGDSALQDGTLWGLDNVGNGGGMAGVDINVVNAWERVRLGESVVVAVIDTGVRYTHQELRARMWRNPDEVPGNGLDDDRDGFVDNVFGINTVRDSGDPMDDQGHGTHIAGTIASGANDGFPHVGIATNARIMACKFLDDEGFGFTSDAIRCIEFAVKNNARIINASWGDGPFSQSLHDAIVRAGEAGVLFVTSAGNDAKDNDRFLPYPASYQIENVISVAALDRRGRLADFSNFGALKVSLAAPGVEIYSTAGFSDSAYEWRDGTSMAAAHVAGVAALILGERPGASLSEIVSRLFSTVKPVVGMLVRSGGSLDAFQALSAEPDGTPELSVSPFDGTEMRSGSVVPIHVRVSDILGITNAVVWAIESVNGSAIDFRNGGLQGNVPNDDYLSEIQVPGVAGVFGVEITVTIPGSLPFRRSVHYRAVDPPLNDDFENAAVVPSPGGQAVVDNRFAGIQIGEPLHGMVPASSGSLWWSWSPQRSGRVIVDTAGSAFDTLLAVYTGGNLGTLVQVAAADDPGDRLQAFVELDGIAGVTYSIVVAGFSEADRGLVHLRVEPEGGPDRVVPVVRVLQPLSGITVTNAMSNQVMISGTAFDPLPNASGISEVLLQVNKGIASRAVGTTNWTTTQSLWIGENSVRVIAVDSAGNLSEPTTLTLLYRPRRAPNDLFAEAAELIGLGGTVRVDNEGASREFGEPAHGGIPASASVWWTYRPGTDGVLRLTTEGSGFDTTLGLYTGSQVSRLTWIAGNAGDGENAAHSHLEQAVMADRTYRIAVDARSGRGGAVRLGYSLKPQPVHLLTVAASSGGRASPAGGVFAHGSGVLIKATPEPGFRFDQWEGDVQSSENPIQVNLETPVNLKAVFVNREFSEDFENGSFGGLDWLHSGAAAWSVQPDYRVSGGRSARSGAVGHGQESRLVVLVDCFPGRGSFQVKVSSEPIWDALEFRLNGVRLARWAGEINWRTFEFLVPGGSNRLEWTYSKDVGGSSVGLDAAFIDDLELPLVDPDNAESLPRLALRPLHGLMFGLELQGARNRTYVIERTEDWRLWIPVVTNTPETGFFRYSGQRLGESAGLFYRAVNR